MFKINTLLSRVMSLGTVQRQSIVFFTWQIMFNIISFPSTMYFAHALGASTLGRYFLFVTYYSIINMVSDGGFSTAAVKRISEGYEQSEYFSAFVLLRSLFVIIVIFAVFYFRHYFVDLNNMNIYTWLLIALIISLIYGSISTGIAGCGKMGIYATCNFINNISRVLIQIIAVFLGYGLAGLAGGFVFGMVIAVVFATRFFNLRFVSFEWKHFKNLLSLSFWVFLTSAGGMIYLYTDTVMIGHYLTNADVGVYRVMLQFASIATITTAALGTTLWPKVSYWGKIDEIILIEKSLSNAINYSLVIAIPIFVGGILVGDKLLHFLYGAEFSNNNISFFILLCVQIINVFQYFFISYIGALNKQKDAFRVTALSALINVVINLILIPMIGISGAAIATLITMLLNAILAKHILSRIINVKLDYSCIFNILKASSIMSLVVVMYRTLIPLSSLWLVLLLVILGGIVYGILILKFDESIFIEWNNIVVKMTGIL